MNLDYFGSGSVPWAAGAYERVEGVVSESGSLLQRTRLRVRRFQVQLRNLRFVASNTLMEDMIRSHAGAMEVGDLALLAETSFGIGFGYLSRFEGRAAWTYFDDAVDRYDRAGDQTWKALALTYGCVARRLVGDVDATKTYAAHGSELVQSVLAPSYQCVLDSCVAWAEIRRFEESSGVGVAIMMRIAERLDHPSIVKLYPFVCFFVFLIMANPPPNQPPNQHHAIISKCAAMLLHETAQQLPPHVEAALAALVHQPDPAALETSLAWARSKNLC